MELPDMNNFSESLSIQLRGALVPVGAIFMWAGKELPPKCRVCDGSALGKTEYRQLYRVIGDKFGSSDTTFNLPHLPSPFDGIFYLIAEGQTKEDEERLEELRDAMHT